MLRAMFRVRVSSRVTLIIDIRARVKVILSFEKTRCSFRVSVRANIRVNFLVSEVVRVEVGVGVRIKFRV